MPGAIKLLFCPLIGVQPEAMQNLAQRSALSGQVGARATTARPGRRSLTCVAAVR